MYKRVSFRIRVYGLCGLGYQVFWRHGCWGQEFALVVLVGLKVKCEGLVKVTVWVQVFVKKGCQKSTGSNSLRLLGGPGTVRWDPTLVDRHL